MTTIGDRIKATRQEKGLSQEELAHAIGTTKSAISRYEAGKRQPNLESLRHIADVLNADIVYLISGQTTVEVENGILIQAETEVRAELEKLQFKSKDRPYEDRVSLSEALIRLFKLFGGFNSIGHKKAVERVEELTEIPRYRAETAQQLLPAPQEGTDTTQPPDTPETPPEGEQGKKEPPSAGEDGTGY